MRNLARKAQTIILLGIYFLCSLIILSSCNKTGASASDATLITINPVKTHQQMIGFGGSLAWYSERIINSSKKNEICQLLFEDLGTDIIRMKSWYYPDNYPAYTGTEKMSDDNSFMEWNDAEQLHALAKHYNPAMKIILTSWGPPAGLKNNASPKEGTLKSDAHGFMYDAFAQYWSDMLDHTTFNPDYICIQNEPTYINPGWTTCQWAATETATLPGYDKAFDKVYEKIRSRKNPPVMIGPDAANIGNGTDGNNFVTFADALKDKPGLAMFSYHAYNFNNTTTPEQTIPLLNVVAQYDKPNIMAEFSDRFDWFNTALFINNTLTQANSSAYIYWKLVWDSPADGKTDAALISIDANGNPTVTPFFYLLKHFAKNIDAGYTRIDASSPNAALNLSAFINPEKTQITMIAINSSNESSIDIKVENFSISKKKVQQSRLTKLYEEVADGTGSVILPSNSVTTVILDIAK